MRALDAVTPGFYVAGSLLLLGLMLVIGADLAGRNLLGSLVPGVPEAVSLSIVAIVFLQVQMALRMGRIARCRALLRALPGRAGRAFESLFDLAGIVAVGAIVWMTSPILTRAWERNLFVGCLGESPFRSGR